MALAAAQRPPGRVIELGAGTGAITRQLLAHGVPPDGLTCIELDPGFVDYLRQAFPHVEAVQGTAESLARIWGERGHGPAAAIVSSLPIRLFDDAATHAVLAASCAVARPGAPFVQLTFRASNPIPRRILQVHGLTGRRRGLVWANVPPAFVWLYRLNEAGAAA